MRGDGWALPTTVALGQATVRVSKINVTASQPVKVLPPPPSSPDTKSCFGQQITRGGISLCESPPLRCGDKTQREHTQRFLVTYVSKPCCCLDLHENGVKYQYVRAYAVDDIFVSFAYATAACTAGVDYRALSLSFLLINIAM